MNKKFYLVLSFGICCLCFVDQSFGQLTISGQIRTRSEFRDGQGTLSLEDTVPAFFTSQRSRLNVGFTAHRVKIFTAVQDVRVWGQDASSINRFTTDANDGFMLHEAWAEISLVDTGKIVKNFALKIGRQEFVYDDVRLLGNLDWLQQARRHDAAVIKFDHRGWTAHLGLAYNQNAERKSNTIYNGVPTAYPASTNGVGANYKSLQFFYLARKLHFGNLSFLTVKDDFSKYHFAASDSLKKNPVYEQATFSRITTGFNFVGTAARKIAFAASAYYQGGRFRDGTKLNEYLLSASFMYNVGRKWSVGPGVDITSGSNDPAKKSARFDPLYGTPHKFWGYMDYFYVADGFGGNGLIDAYLKAKYKAKDNLVLMLDVHSFSLPEAVNNESGLPMEKSLGTELDFVFSYAMTKFINVEGGYCRMFGTQTLASTSVKNVAGADTNANWAYLMLSIKPEIILNN